MLMDCMPLIKTLWFKQPKSILEYSSKNEMNWNIRSWSTEWPGGWRTEEELATPDYSAHQVSLHHPLWMLAVPFKCFNPSVTLVEIHSKERERVRAWVAYLTLCYQRTKDFIYIPTRSVQNEKDVIPQNKVRELFVREKEYCTVKKKKNVSST